MSTGAWDYKDTPHGRRAFFTLRLRSGALPDYLHRHSPVPPDMLRALRDAGWRHYSIFVDRDLNLVHGYFESADTDVALATVSLNAVNQKWQAESEIMFDGPIRWLPEVFNLDDQLASGSSEPFESSNVTPDVI